MAKKDEDCNEESRILSKADVDLIINTLLERMYQEIGRGMLRKLVWGVIIVLMGIAYGIIDWHKLFHSGG